MNSNQKNDVKDKAFELMLEEVVEKYSIDAAEQNDDLSLTDNEISSLMRKKDKIYKKLKKQINQEQNQIKPVRLKKRILVVAALIALLAASFNVSAVRTFVYKTCVSLTDTKIIFKPEQVEKDNYSTIKNFENKNDIIIPTWLPPGVEISQIDDYSTSILLHYYEDDFWMTIHHQVLSDEIIGGGFGAITEGNKYSVSDIKVMGVDGKLLDMTSEADVHFYSVYWCTDTTEYELSMGGSKIMLETILENLKYLNKL